MPKSQAHTAGPTEKALEIGCLRMHLWHVRELQLTNIQKFLLIKIRLA